MKGVSFSCFYTRTVLCRRTDKLYQEIVCQSFVYGDPQASTTMDNGTVLTSLCPISEVIDMSPGPAGFVYPYTLSN